GHLRDFGFMRWQDFDGKLWEEVKVEARAAERPYTGTIYASDLDLKAVHITRENVTRAGLEEAVRLRRQDFLQTRARGERGIVFLNPPYGERLQPEALVSLYAQIGDTLKQGYAGHDAWLLSSSQPALKAVGLRPARKWPLYNGALACQLRHYELYQGSREKA
ncbi:MAG: class I SAM-dependent RNA methyltransferase, partial [Bacteroidetes bacterium]